MFIDDNGSLLSVSLRTVDKGMVKSYALLHPERNPFLPVYIITRFLKSDIVLHH